MQDEGSREHQINEEEFINPQEYREIVPRRLSYGTKHRALEEDINDNHVIILLMGILCPLPLERQETFLPFVKDTIATVSYRAGVSVDKAIIATQTVCEVWYGHKYYKTVDEQDMDQGTNESSKKTTKNC